ncbi:hypothetical protein [Mesorhizobium loti]|uniref:Lipocalin-like domain-containing protein n=1 Tax=Mesorhizobium loti R88b TaxID=935548 RepID=A0A6M7WSG9_RHILI|nr:hypothetical protein [Mesorhizobium loti]QKD03743.1 hypothetical protein EB235_21495 [Mesorhizobium loti R88b]
MSANGEKTTESLTGIWHGRYFYPRSLEPVSFVATLIETATRLTGAVHEPASSLDGSIVYATILGDCAGAIVAFVKTYDNLKRNPHPVEYNGVLNGDATEIEGTWRIKGYWSGTFLMIRSPGKAVSVSRKAVEQV